MAQEITNLFEEIPYDWRKPGTYVEIRPNYENVGLFDYPTRILIIGQMFDDAPAAEKQIYEITRKEQGSALFGAGSIADQMIRALKRNNSVNEVHCICLKDLTSGTQASGTIKLSGSGSGMLPVYINGRRIRISISGNDAPAAMAAKVAAALNDIPDLPVTAAVSAETVTVTAKHKGECGNDIDIRVAYRADEMLPVGILADITDMTGGTGNPEIQDILDNINQEWFTDIVIPWTDNTNLIAVAEDFEERFEALGKKDAHAYAFKRGTYGQLVTIGSVTNSPHLTILGGDGFPSAPWTIAAALAGIAAFHLTQDPARQLRSLELDDVLGPVPEKRFTVEEQNLLLHKGISTFNVLSDGTVTLDRVITTYQKSNLDIPDEAWLDITVVKTVSRIRYDWISYLNLMYPRFKLADDDTQAAIKSNAVVTPKRMYGSWAARCRIYEDQAWIEGAKETLLKSSFWRSSQDKNRMEGKQIIRIIGNLIVFAGSLQFEV